MLLPATPCTLPGQHVSATHFLQMQRDVCEVRLVPAPAFLSDLDVHCNVPSVLMAISTLKQMNFV